MMQNQRPPIRRIAFPILIALSISHCLNDMMQSVISAVYPLFKEDLSLSFAQIVRGEKRNCKLTTLNRTT